MRRCDDASSAERGASRARATQGVTLKRENVTSMRARANANVRANARVNSNAFGARASSGAKSSSRAADAKSSASSSGAKSSSSSSSSSSSTTSGETNEQPTKDVRLRAAWFGAEALGRAIEANDRGKVKAARERAERPRSRAEALALIADDYAKEYFVSGDGDMAAYDDDCAFADPFVEFAGVERFKRNVGNLGGMMRDVDLRVTSFEETASGAQTEWTFSCVLDLPWRPRLSAAGGTTHEIDATTNLVVRHYERWDVDPYKVLGQLLKPASKVPESQAEVFMMSATSGDVIGAIGAIAPELFKVSAPVWLTSAAARAATHSESTGVENAFGFLFALAVVGQLGQLLRGIGMS